MSQDKELSELLTVRGFILDFYNCNLQITHSACDQSHSQNFSAHENFISSFMNCYKIGDKILIFYSHSIHSEIEKMKKKVY